MTKILTLVFALILLPQKVNQTPVVVLTAPASGIVGASVTIDGSATHDDSPVGPQVWLYSFGDGGVTSGQGAVPRVTHIYTAPGNFVITLTVTDNKHKVGTAVAPIGISGVAPPPDTTPPTAPTNVQATTTTTTAHLTWGPSTDLGGSGIAWYQVWMTNVLVQTITSGTVADFVSLTCGTQYTFDVNAVDYAGNPSVKTSRTVQTSACVVVTPTTLVFTAPVDYATNVTSCTVELRRGGDATTVTPVAVRNLGKPAAVSGDVTVDISTLVDPLPAGSYYGIVVATNTGGATASLPSAVFTK